MFFRRISHKYLRVLENKFDKIILWDYYVSRKREKGGRKTSFEIKVLDSPAIAARGLPLSRPWPARIGGGKDEGLSYVLV